MSGEEAGDEAGQVSGGEPSGEIRELSAGGFHTCAIMNDGAVRCWGQNAFGQLGHGHTKHIGDDETLQHVPSVDVGGPVRDLAAGDTHTCALMEAGTVRCWGQAYLGKLGYGNMDKIGDDEAPATAGDVDVGGQVVQLAAGGGHTCALLDTGAVRCWGVGTNGQHGYAYVSAIGNDETPAAAGDVDVGGSVVQIAAGGYHTCALLDTGTVRCWGYNVYGQLGYEHIRTIGDNETPASAGDVDVGGKVVQLSAGWLHTCALLDTGAVRCWGSRNEGQLGYGGGNENGDETPAALGDVDVGGTVVQVAAGGYHTCALLNTGAVRCWGAGTVGQLGYGKTSWIGDDETPSSVGDVPLGGTATQITTGLRHACARLETGAARCWGHNERGQLGYGHTSNLGDDETPASVGDIPFL